MSKLWRRRTTLTLIFFLLSVGINYEVYRDLDPHHAATDIRVYLLACFVWLVGWLQGHGTGTRDGYEKGYSRAANLLRVGRL